MATIYKPLQDAGVAPGNTQNDNTAYQMCLFFTVTANCQINAVDWYVASGQYTNSLGDEQIALFTVTGKYAFTLVTGSIVSAPEYVTGQWNRIPFSHPIALTAGTEYAAAKGVSSAAENFNYSIVPDLFETGNPGANGITDGPVLVYSDGTLGNSNLEPFGAGQCAFYANGPSQAPPPMNVDFPHSSFSASWYGMDLEIETGSGQGGGDGGVVAALIAAGVI